MGVGSCLAAVCWAIGKRQRVQRFSKRGKGVFVMNGLLSRDLGGGSEGAFELESPTLGLCFIGVYVDEGFTVGASEKTW